VSRTALQSGYPPTLAALVEGVPDARSPDKRLIYFLRRLPRDPMTDDTGRPGTDNWGKRSYASPPESPTPGADVFDVYSLSAGIGLSGVPYKEW